MDSKDNQVIEECILFGFPFNNDIMHVLNFFIYIQSLFNNSTLDLYACLTQLKQALKIEENVDDLGHHLTYTTNHALQYAKLNTPHGRQG